MAAAVTEPVRAVRSSRGRVRVHLPFWDGSGQDELEQRVQGLEGVVEASARSSTGNLLIRFVPETIDEDTLLHALRQLAPARRSRKGAKRSAARSSAGKPRGEPEAKVPIDPDAEPLLEPSRRGPGWASPEPVRATAGRFTASLREQAGRFGRARIAVRGIDRDPELARRVVSALERRPDVRRAVASAATGRVLVEFSDRVTSLQDLLSELSKLELPELPGEDRPAHPLDPTPVIQSGTRLAGAALGLGMLGIQRVFGVTPQGRAAQIPAVAAGVLGLIDGTPPVRDELRERLGRDQAQLLLSGAAILSLTLSGSPLGLLVSGAGALRLFTESRARRNAWREYERRVGDAHEAQPGAVVRLEPGSRVPLHSRVLEGTGTVVGADGLPDGASPGTWLTGGARVLSGPLVVELVGGRAWAPSPRPCPTQADLLERYVTAIAPASLVYALLLAAVRRSPAMAFTGLLLVNPRAALIGSEAADTGASARVLRAGVTVVGTRPERQIRCPDVLLVDGPRVLTAGLEPGAITPAGSRDRAELTTLVSTMLTASGAPWGPGLGLTGARRASKAHFDGTGVTATIDGRELRLAPPEADEEDRDEVRRAVEAGEQPLVLRALDREEVIAHVRLRPKLAHGVGRLRRRCQEHGVELVVLERDDRRASRAVARRAELPLVLEADLADLVRERQRAGERVAVLSDSPAAAEAFDACDLAIALSSGRSSVFQARADLLAPGLPAVTSIITAGVRRDQASDAAVGFSVAANLAGALWGFQGEPGVTRASQATYVGALGALGMSWQRLRGGRRARSVISRLTDPHPERWGDLDPAEVLAAVNSRSDGLREAEARARHTPRRNAARRNDVMAAVQEQLESPLVAVLGAGAAISLAAGAVADVAIIAAVIVANTAVGAWQTRQAGEAVAALEELGAAHARVLRAGEPTEIDADEVVKGDILLVGAGDRVVADARLLEADALEVDEAALTGESLPVPKSPEAETPTGRVLLEGSDVTVGTGVAVVIAVGDETRMGATAQALAVEENGDTPLGRRLDRLFRQGMPVVVAGGLLVTLAGIAWGGAPLAQLALGASVAVAAVPEGLPLMAGVAEASVARRLASRSALVRRLSSVEALGRVDVACCDKTGTLTQGRLAVTLVDDLKTSVALAERLGDSHAAVLLTAGLASPAPDAPDALAHPTDAAILGAAEDAGLTAQLSGSRTAEAPFDPVRSLHVTMTRGGLSVKGAAEVLVPRCRYMGSNDEPLDGAGRAWLLERAEALAERGLRVLMVAEGPAGSSVEDPQDLRAMGFVGISDPLRPGVADAVARCREAGIRVVMLTGDHPATARAIAAEAGLPLGPGSVITGEEIGESDTAMDPRRLERASVIARITPLDKVRIVDHLQSAGHTVAMTGDGVNDAPALRLADVGVAMGAGGTDVARQAADLVLADDRFETLTEALLEGRSLWHNLHGALGLLLGGNLGEIALMAGATLAGGRTVLGTRQVLAVNLVSDVLPAIAVAAQPPLQRDLRAVAREGAESFDRRLMQDVIRRGVATGVPALAAVLLAVPLGAAPTSVAFASIILTQLAQTLQAGYSEEQLSPSVVGAIAGSGGVLVAALTVPPLRNFLGLPPTNLASALLSGATAPAAVLLARRRSELSARSEPSGAGRPSARFPTARTGAPSGI